MNDTLLFMCHNCRQWEVGRTQVKVFSNSSNYQWKRRLPLIDIWPGSTIEGHLGNQSLGCVQATSRQLQSDVWQMNLFQCEHSWMLNLWICHFIRLCMYLPVKASFQPRLTCFCAARRATCDALHRSNVDWLKSGLEQGRKRQQSSPGMMQKKQTNPKLCVVCCYNNSVSLWDQ